MINKELSEEQELAGEQELNRLQEKHEKHYKLVRTVRKGVALGLAAVSVITAMAVSKGRKNMGINPTKTEIEQMMEEPKIELDRYYIIPRGDNLSAISSRTGIPISRLRSDNGMDQKDSLIFANDVMYLCYSIDPEDIEYYTQSVDVSGKTASQLAREYDTREKTLYTINNGNIVKNEDGTYTITSDTILVPNFITQKELSEAKEAHQK